MLFATENLQVTKSLSCIVASVSRATVIRYPDFLRRVYSLINLQRFFPSEICNGYLIRRIYVTENWVKYIHIMIGLATDTLCLRQHRNRRNE